MDPQPERPGLNEPAFDRRLYWLVLVVAAVFVVALYWFTTAFNVPLGASGR